MKLLGVVLTVVVWLSLLRLFGSDGFAAGFIAGGTLIGALAYLIAWARGQDAIDELRRQLSEAQR